MEKSLEMYKNFTEEYGSDDAIRKYTSGTAGYGISYLLDRDYAQIYLRAVDSELQTQPRRPLRLLEFGCGGGMNIIRLVALLERRGIQVESAQGTDFSARLVHAAEHEAKALLSSELAGKVSFCVARNECLLDDLTAARGTSTEELNGSFDLIIGVNTFRYCLRLKKERECAADIYRMLRPGGVCINIDMNNRFPAFRSRLRDMERNQAECYIPTLEEYASPFEACGFEILRRQNFCWVPHSAGVALTQACRFLSPLLNLVARSRAMRSLVVARRPASHPGSA